MNFRFPASTPKGLVKKTPHVIDESSIATASGYSTEFGSISQGDMGFWLSSEEATEDKIICMELELEKHKQELELVLEKERQELERKKVSLVPFYNDI